MKTGNAPGPGNICTEMLKTAIYFAEMVFIDRFRERWTNDVIPSDWNKAQIVHLPKRGDLEHCGNWRLISLLSIPDKLFCRVLQNGIEGAIDLRQEQLGFRRRKGCTYQIFSFCNIIEHSIECNTPLCIGFINFKKAFDSIHNSTL